ncbi:hypothetical protein [Rhizobium terrae]|uniref:hypothetical protein n=1 Tax=Rhizobium terrae TaxID=2171756 RepID=UPI000E3ED9E4|nr:hypothetical protein [Rhizobium terrae]
MRKKRIEALNALEKERLLEIIAAAKSGDWERFSFLTDKPFSNESSMREQFEDSSQLIKNLNKNPEFDVEIKTHKDGSRLIFAKIAMDNPDDNPILLTLHSFQEESKNLISIWTFYQEISFK